MSDLKYLSKKNCSCCKVRLDKVDRRYIQTLNLAELVDKVNEAKATILEKSERKLIILTLSLEILYVKIALILQIVIVGINYHKIHARNLIFKQLIQSSE